MKFLSVTIQTKATKQYFPMVLFVMVHTDMIPTFEFGETKNLKCDHWNWSFLLAALFWGDAC